MKTLDHWIPLLLALIAALPGWYAAFFREPKKDQAAILKTRAEAEKTEEETEILRLERAERLAAKVSELETRMDELEAENEALKKNIARIENENLCLRQENGDLRDWAERLVKQIYDLGDAPAILRKRRGARRAPLRDVIASQAPVIASALCEAIQAAFLRFALDRPSLAATCRRNMSLRAHCAKQSRLLRRKVRSSQRHVNLK